MSATSNYALQVTTSPIFGQLPLHSLHFPPHLVPLDFLQWSLVALGKPKPLGPTQPNFLSKFPFLPQKCVKTLSAEDNIELSGFHRIIIHS